MPVSFQREYFKDTVAEARPLLIAHWKELARNKDLIELNPDYSKYLQIEQLDLMRVYTARENGSLVGYAVYMLSPHLHYMDHVWAASDIFWLHPANRKGFTGVKLLKFAETSLRDGGVSVMHTTVKIAHPAAGKVLEYLGHTPIEIGYAKILTKTEK
jgi:hypothetical protein